MGVTNKVSAVRVLLELSADSCAQDLNGATCAHYAVQLDHVHVVAALLDVHWGEHWGALTVKDDNDRSAFDCARCDGRAHMVQLMQSRMGGPMPMLWQVFRGWM